MFPRVLIGLVLVTSAFAAAPDFDAALALRRARRLPEARAAFEKLVTAEPANAPAWHELGLVWHAQRDTPGFQKAVECLEKAVQLAPGNAEFLADYAGTLMELASRTRSMTAATKGRDAMEKAVAMAPDNVQAREGLYQFYLQAPFFIGGSARKADAQLAEIRRRDPDRATALAVTTKVQAKDYAGAFAVCDAVLAEHPDNATALYHYGRTASVSGTNVERGVACLRRVLESPGTGPSTPLLTQVWFRLGDLEEKLGHVSEAKQAYERALNLDPENRAAKTAFERIARSMDLKSD